METSKIFLLRNRVRNLIIVCIIRVTEEISKVSQNPICRVCKFKVNIRVDLNMTPISLIKFNKSRLFQQLILTPYLHVSYQLSHLFQLFVLLSHFGATSELIFKWNSMENYIESPELWKSKIQTIPLCKSLKYKHKFRVNLFEIWWKFC